MTLALQAQTRFGVALTANQLAQFDVYQRELLAWNAHTNLTAITDPPAVQTRHFLDSLSVALVAPLSPQTHLIDVGAGAGFPGLALAIAFPNTPVTVMDATGKKVRFMQHIIDTLKLQNANAFQARAEDAGQDLNHRARYPVVAARAVARLPALLEYLLPLTAVDGVCIAMKGSTAHSEAHDAAHALRILGGKLHRITPVQLPNVEHPHHLIVVHKHAPTPPEFPRRAGLPTRDPL